MSIATDSGSETPIVVVLSAFGAELVRQHGQAWCADLAVSAGASGVEVRSELFRQAPAEMAQISLACRNVELIYSCATPLFSSAGEFNVAEVDTALERATLLGAKRIKFSIGGGSRVRPGQLERLRGLVQNTPLAVMVENDQSDTAGTARALTNFFALADQSGIHLQMAFDIGNWYWTGECPQSAAVTFRRRITYVHTKGVMKQPSRWVAVPLRDSQAPWRTVLDAMPTHCPWAIEYPLQGEDLFSVTREAIENLRGIRGGCYGH